MQPQQIEIPTGDKPTTSSRHSQQRLNVLDSMPVCDDRDAADLRGRVSVSTWHADVNLCLQLRLWMITHGFSPLEASRRIGVPHVTVDVMQRLSECRRPFGQSIGIWQDLHDLSVRVEARRLRDVETAADAFHGRPLVSPANSSPVQPTIKPQAQTRPQLSELRSAIIAEIGRGGGRRSTPNARTTATAQKILDVASAVKPLGSGNQRGVNRLNMPQLYTLATMLAADEQQEIARTTHTQSTPSNSDYTRWYKRLEAYAPQVDEIRKLRPSPVVVSAPAATPTPADVVGKIVGRPRLLLNGRVAVKLETLLEIGPSDSMWTEAMRLVNE